MNSQKKLFKNPVLDRLTYTHIAVPIGLFLIYGIGLLYWNITTIQLSVFLTISLFISGLLLFTLVEYAVHRFIFHMRPTNDLKKKVQYTFHGIHHDYPKDKDRLAMPPLVSISVATLLLLAIKFLIGDYVFAFLPGFLFGYAGYLLVHYMVHAYHVPNNAFKILWVHHAIHHYKLENKAFGVSSPLWDYVFNTMPYKSNLNH